MFEEELQTFLQTNTILGTTGTTNVFCRQKNVQLQTLALFVSYFIINKF